MAERTLVLTDPARELAELCASLQAGTNQPGESFLAKRFEVDSWSPEFFQIIFTIVERCELLKSIVATLDLDDDLKQEVANNIDQITLAFSATAMKNAWSGDGLARVGPVNLGPIKAISGLVRQKVAYRKLSDDEIQDIEKDVEDLLKWLEEHKLNEQDFLRQALIEGVSHFQFRLKRLKWLGWGYTLDALREVIAAYMLLERGAADPTVDPKAAAVLQKVGGCIRSVYEKVTATKEAAETADWLLKAYGAGSLVYQAGKPLIAGLLSAS